MNNRRKESNFTGKTLGIAENFIVCNSKMPRIGDACRQSMECLRYFNVICP